MTENKSDVEIVITDKAFSIVQNEREFLILTVREDDNQLMMHAPLFDDIELIELEQIPDRERDLLVGIRRRERKVAQLKSVSRTKKERTPKKRGKKRVVAAVDQRRETPLEEWQRNTILEQVVESFVSDPKQTKKDTAEYSHRIATDVFGDDSHHNVMRVAGVRAALTRGCYDKNLEEMVEENRPQKKEMTYGGGVAG